MRVQAVRTHKISATDKAPSAILDRWWVGGSLWKTTRETQQGP